MASYLGASYQAAVGPSDRDVTLFAPRRRKSTAFPRPRRIWRKQVRLDDLAGCGNRGPSAPTTASLLVLDDLGDRCTSSTWAWTSGGPRNSATGRSTRRLRGGHPRHDVSDWRRASRVPIALLLSALPALPRALGAGDSGGRPGPGPARTGRGRLRAAAAAPGRGGGGDRAIGLAVPRRRAAMGGRDPAGAGLERPGRVSAAGRASSRGRARPASPAMQQQPRGRAPAAVPAGTRHRRAERDGAVPAPGMSGMPNGFSAHGHSAD